MRLFRLPAYAVSLLAATLATACGQSHPAAPDANSPESRDTAAVTVYPARNWKAAILTCSPDEVTVANYLKTKSAVAYPKVAITIIPVTITPDLTATSGSVTQTVMYNAVSAAIAPKEAAMGDKFDMIQLLHQFPHHVSWANSSSPGGNCGVSTNNNWSPESIISAGIDTVARGDSPPSFGMEEYGIPFTGPIDLDENWRLIYLCTRLEGRTVAEVKAKIDLACAAPTVARPGALIDGPGKAGRSNNGSGDTYWENTWFNDGLKYVAGHGTAYGFPVKNDMTGYTGDKNNNNNDDASEMPAAAWPYQTTSTFPVGYFLSYGYHSNGDGRMAAGFPGTTAFRFLPFATRSVILGGESFSAYGLDSSHPGYGGSNLGQWLALPSAGYIGPKNEPCATGINTSQFVKAYVGQNATFGESAYSAFPFIKSIYTPFGVAWMTLR